MSPSKIRSGCDVYLRNPQRLYPNCTCIVGVVERTIKRAGARWATVNGYVGKMGGGHPLAATFLLEELGTRTGTPMSIISVRPGEPGYREWCRISRSWGY